MVIWKVEAQMESFWLFFILPLFVKSAVRAAILSWSLEKSALVRVLFAQKNRPLSRRLWNLPF
jgi:hypothetical protein